MSTEPRIGERRVRAALDEIARGAATTPNRIPEPRSVAAPRMTASRLAMVAAAVALVVGAGALLVRRNAPEAITDQPPEDPTADATAEWFTDLEPDSVAPLPDAPIAGRFGPASVWTGSEMIVWGGAHTIDGGEKSLDDGAAFDPVTGAWRVLPDAPIEGRAYASTIWTGSEMVVWGGGRGGEFVGDGAAYDPITDTWRVIAASPKPAAMKSAVAWTGTEMIVIGGLNQGGAAAAYDPTADAWRSLPDAPGSVPPPYPQAVWTEEAVLVPMVCRATAPRTVSGWPCTGPTSTSGNSSRRTCRRASSSPPPAPSSAWSAPKQLG